MQTENVMSSDLTEVNKTDNISAEEGGQGLPSSNGECAKWHEHSGQLAVFTTLNTFLPYDPVISFLGIYSRDIKTNVLTNTCTRLFIAFLFIRTPN